LSVNITLYIMKKKLLITAAVVASLFAILLVLPFAFEGKIEKIIKAEANKTMQAKLDFRSLNLSFIRNFPKATIGLENLTITGIDSFALDTLIKADELRISVDIMSLFGDKGYDVSHILLDGADIRLHVLRSGRANWDIVPTDTTQQAAPAEKPSTFRLNLKELEAKNSRFRYLDEQGNMDFSINDLNSVCSGDMSADVTNLKLKADAAEMNFTMDKVPYMNKMVVHIDGEIEADLKNSKYTFRNNTCRVNAVEAALEGWFAMPKEGYDMDIRLKTNQLDFKQVLSLVPGMFTKQFDEIETAGVVSMDAWAKGHYSDSVMPAFNLALNVDKAMFKYPSLPRKVDQIRMNLKVSNPGGSTDKTVVDLQNLQFSMGGNPFSLMALIKTPVSNPDFALKANGKLDLSMIKEVYPLEKGTELTGKLIANLQVKGTMKQIEREMYDQINASGTLSLAGIIYKSAGYPDVLVNNLALNFTPKFVEMTDMNLRFGKTDISARGRLENFIAYALKDKTLKGNLTMSSKQMDINELMGNSSSSGQSDTTAMQAFEIPKNIDFILQAAIQKISYDKMNFENASGKILINNGKIDFNGLRMNAFGGVIETDGYYSTAVDPKKPDISLALNVVNASFAQTFQQLDFVKKMMPLFESTVGNYSVNFKLSGKLDEKMSPDLKTLLAQGLLQSQNVQVKEVKALDALALAMKDDKYKNISVKDLKLPFSIEDGKVKTKPFDITMGDAKINLSGVTTLDKTIDYNGIATLPAGVVSKLGSNIQQIGFKIGGTFTQPKVTLDYKSIAKSLVKEAATKGIQKALGVKDDAELQAKIAAARQEARAKADQIIEQADQQAQALIEKAGNPIAKIAAKKVAEQLKKEAQKRAQNVVDEAEAKVVQMQAK